MNYHQLDRKRLETLAYTYLGDWIRRQEEGVRKGEGGAEGRLTAAQALQEKLELILKGEPPYDIFVRWKPLEEQPMGWEPDSERRGAVEHPAVCGGGRVAEEAEDQVGEGPGEEPAGRAVG